MNGSWAQAAAVAIGAAVGALLRWQAQAALNSLWPQLPLGTLLVNCVGGALIGMAVVWFEQMPSELLRLLLVTGVLGGLTTFSAYSGESLSLLQSGRYGAALIHTLAHVLGSLICAGSGFWLMRRLLGLPIA